MSKKRIFSKEHFCQERQVIYTFMRDNKDKYPVAKMCKVMNINSSSYYYWVKTQRVCEKKEISS